MTFEVPETPRAAGRSCAQATLIDGNVGARALIVTDTAVDTMAVLAVLADCRERRIRRLVPPGPLLWTARPVPVSMRLAQKPVVPELLELTRRLLLVRVRF